MKWLERTLDTISVILVLAAIFSGNGHVAMVCLTMAVVIFTWSSNLMAGRLKRDYIKFFGVIKEFELDNNTNKPLVCDKYTNDRIEDIC